MGLRQSKRSVDISGSPKKEAPAAVVEKIPQNNDASNQTIENAEEENKTPINGEAKTSEPVVELVRRKRLNCESFDHLFITNLTCCRKRASKRTLRTKA